MPGTMNPQQQDHTNLVIYWDYASTRSNSAASTVSSYSLVGNIRSACLDYGPVRSFRAYGNFSRTTSSKSASVRSELSSSGVTVIDFPEDGQEGAGVKTMLVDIVTHAWDHPDAHMYVIISNDRDVGYVVGTLRMRKFSVIVISSIASHVDLTGQASTKLDWSKIALGIHGDSTRPANFSETNITSSQFPTSSFSFRQNQSESNQKGGSHTQRTSLQSAQKPFEQVYPDLVELQDLPPPGGRSRSHSVFSTYDHRKFEAFGTFPDVPFMPKAQPPPSGLGDGPLFPRPMPFGEDRAQSGSPHVAYAPKLSQSVFPPFSEDEGSPPSAWRGKARANSTHLPESVIPETVNIYADSIFEPFPDIILDVQSSAAMPPHAQKEHMIQDILSSTASSSSRSSKFSAVHRSDTTALTTAASGTDKLTDIQDTKSVSSGMDYKTYSAGSEPVLKSSAVSSERDSTATFKAEKATSPILPPYLESITDTSQEKEVGVLTRPFPNSSASDPASLPLSVAADAQIPQVVTGKKSVSPPVKHNTAPPAVPKAAPKVNTLKPSTSNVDARFQPLVAVLRRQGRSRQISKTELGSLLVNEDQKVYSRASVKKFHAYISLAVKAGIVAETQDGQAVVLIST